MFDLKQIQLVLTQLEEEKGITREQITEAIESALASAYKKEFGKKGQMVQARFDIESGDTTFVQIKQVMDPEMVIDLPEEEAMPDQEHLPEEERKVRLNPELHMFKEQAKLIKADAEIGDELIFPLENKTDFGRIAAQTAKQVIIQKIREAEKGYLTERFGDMQGEIVSGTVQRVERGNIFVDLGKAEGSIPYAEQIKSERYKTGDRISGYLFNVDEAGRGVFLRLSRTHPKFMEKLFEREVPELGDGTLEIKNIAREPGFRSKVAVYSLDEEIDPIGALVGQNGSRVQTVTSELSGERIDIIEWSEDMDDFIRQALSPAEILNVELHEDGEDKLAKVQVAEDQFSLAIGRGGQNVRLAARLTGYKIDIQQIDANGNVIDQEARRAEREAEREAQEAAKADAEASESVMENMDNADAVETEAEITAETVGAADPTDEGATLPDDVVGVTEGADNNEPVKANDVVEAEEIEAEIEEKEEMAQELTGDTKSSEEEKA